MGCTSVKIGLLLGFGAFIAVLSAITVIYWPSIFSNQLNKQLALTNVSQTFEIWKEIPIPMYLEIFMWNITNHLELVAGTADKIIVEQKGPYVFRENHVKVNMEWNDNHTITFQNKRTWQFVPEKTNGSLDDEITSINVIIATIAYEMRHQSFLVNFAANSFINLIHEHMFVSKPVREWIFDGYEDPLIDWAKEHFPNLIPIPYDRFGWFVDRNNSETFDGVFNMYTGTDDINLLGYLAAWNYRNHTGFFSGECGEVKGSMGELWPPETHQKEVTIFASDLCSYMTLPESGDISVQGISGVEYKSSESFFDNGYRYPEKACFCDADRTHDCPLPGALNVSMCRLGAPAFVSLPNYRRADPYYTRNIIGMNPTEEHDFGMGLELFTGIPLAVAAQLQINILVRRVSGFSVLNVIPDDTFVPMFWFRQEMEMTPEYASLARGVLLLRNGVEYAALALLVVGVILLLCGVVFLVRKLYKGSDTVPLIENDPRISNQ